MEIKLLINIRLLMVSQFIWLRERVLLKPLHHPEPLHLPLELLLLVELLPEELLQLAVLHSVVLNQVWQQEQELLVLTHLLVWVECMATPMEEWVVAWVECHLEE